MQSRNANLLSHSLMYLQVVFVFYMNLQLLLEANASGNGADQFALLKFKEEITSDPHEALKSWNASIRFCSWFGIRCGRKHQRVTSLVIQGQSLRGTLTPFLGNLSFLRVIDLQGNSFHGEIPQEIGFLFRLRRLFLLNNTLEGNIPVNLTGCSKLKEVDLTWNKLVGNIPAELGSLPTLEALQLGANNLTGEIPSSIGNISSLTVLSVGYNNLVGHIPIEVSQLTRLTYFSIGANRLSGMIPPTLFNISSINTFSATQNQLHGILPGDIGLTLPNLQAFTIGTNKISGPIPNSIANASQLQILDVGWNDFVGQVPGNLGSLQSLWWLHIGHNNLGFNSANDLAFLTYLTNCSSLEVLDLGSNNFGGVLPISVTNLSMGLNRLFLGNNHISGVIPSALENLINLILLDLYDNFFVGYIPSSLGKLNKLQVLYLYQNGLSGQIPSSIGNLTQLFQLDLSDNNLEGGIPPSIGNCRNLLSLVITQTNISGSIPATVIGLPSLSLALNLSWNTLTGALPAEVGNLKSIDQLDVSENNLSGQIPGSIGDCSSLEYLYMQGNSFRGLIPSSLASVKGLQYIDLSRNNLSGEIPHDLQNLRFLLYLNLSFNNLQGEVPTKGIFRNASAVSLIGNKKLCGGVPDLYLSNCPPNKVKKSRKSLTVRLAIIITSVVACALSMLVFLLVWRMRKLKEKPSSASMLIQHPVQVSYRDLYQATAGFSSSNLIGSGGFGVIYKGVLDQIERPVAIKVFNLEQKGASKSFIAECEALRNIRHRNLVKILTSCSSIDSKGNDFKALVFEFMENGSLEKRLHPEGGDENQTRSLNLLQRLNIAIDVASALHYLHDLWERPIIHCDLKPSNVLLDDDMVAHVSDFGLARLFQINIDGSSQNQASSTVGFKGTIGYAAPEYGMGGAASKEGDAYSYGILLLEMFTGTRPTGRIFEGDLNLHVSVKKALPEGLAQIVDPTIVPRGNEQVVAVPEVEDDNNDEIQVAGEAETSNPNLSRMRAKEKGCLLSVFRVGLACSVEAPQERMKMRDVTKELNMIKRTFLGAQIRG